MGTNKKNSYLLAILVGLVLPLSMLSNLAAADPAQAAISPAGSVVSVGTGTYPLYGVDVYRPADTLVIYTRTSARSVSPANRWGFEAALVNGVVTRTVDRQATGASGLTIPATGVVVTGHGAARTWLLSRVKVGTQITIPVGIAPTSATPTATASATPSPSVTASSAAPISATPSPSVSATHTSATATPTTPTATPTTPMATPSTTPSAAASASPAATSSTGKWMSGAAGDGVPDGSFAAWRGSQVPIAGTWVDTLEASTEVWAVLKGFEYGSWQGDLDIATGGIWQSNGETWAAAATGAYDARWRKGLTALATAWAGRPGTMHIRFAHEFNGDWVPWKVPSSQTSSFIAAWKRYRALQKAILPKAKLVFCPNVDSSASLSLDWRNAFPGAAYVDEMSVDSYNDWPYVNTASAFTSKINMTDSNGAPAGIEKHRLFAASVGLPLAISEWSSNSSDGDGDNYMKLFHDWVASHAGTGAGQVPYEIIFNVGYFNSGLYQVFPNTLMPKAAAAYAAVF